MNSFCVFGPAKIILLLALRTHAKCVASVAVVSLRLFSAQVDVGECERVDIVLCAPMCLRSTYISSEHAKTVLLLASLGNAASLRAFQ